MENRNIVIHADDQRMTRGKVKTVVKNLGLLFQGAENGEEVLDILEILSENVALIILDWEMPILNGFNCLKEIKSYAKYNQIPVIFYSGITRNDLIQKALSRGAKRFVSKSREIGYLEETIVDILKNQNEY